MENSAPNGTFWGAQRSTFVVQLEVGLMKIVRFLNRS